MKRSLMAWSCTLSVVLAAACTWGAFVDSSVSPVSAQEAAVGAATQPDADDTVMRPESRPATSHDRNEVRGIGASRFLPDQLTQRLILDFPGDALGSVATYISETIGVPIRLHVSLEDSGITPHSEVSIQTRDVPVYVALHRFLQDVDGVPCTWMWEEGMLTFCTVDFAEAEEAMTTEVHDIGALLEQGYDTQELIDVISNMIDADWLEIDGFGGDTSEFGNLIVVRQTQRVQREVKCLLAALSDPRGVTWIDAEQSDLEALAALDKPVESDGTITQVHHMTDLFSQMCGVEIGLHVSLEDSGLTEDSEVSVLAEGQSLRFMARELDIDGVPVTLLPRLGRLELTTIDYAESEDAMRTVVFEAGDLVREGELQFIIDIFQSNIDGDWFEVDGFGGQVNAVNGNTLVIRQTDHVLHDIRQLLATIRRLSQPIDVPPRDPNEIVTRIYRVSPTAAETIVETIQQEVAPDSWWDRKEGLDPGISVVQIDAAAAARLPSYQSGFFQISGQGAQGNQPPTPPPHAALITRQTRSIHKKIESFLSQVGVLISSPQPRNIRNATAGFCGKGHSGGQGGFFSIPSTGKSPALPQAVVDDHRAMMAD